MGEVDTERQALNVARMRLLGAEVVPVDDRLARPSRTPSTRRCATGSPTSTTPTTASARSAGPHPFPVHRARLPARHRRSRPARRCWRCTGRLPDAVAACVGGGSNAIGIFHAFLDDPAVRLVGFEAGGDGVETGRHAATLTGGSPGVLHGAHSYVLQDEDGQTIESHSISAGLDYPGVGPEHASSTTSAAPSTAPSPTPRRWTRSRCSPHARASSRPSSPRTRCGRARTRPASSGAGAIVAGQPLRPRRQGHGHRREVVRPLIPRRRHRRARRA